MANETGVAVKTRATSSPSPAGGTTHHENHYAIKIRATSLVSTSVRDGKTNSHNWIRTNRPFVSYSSHQKTVINSESRSASELTPKVS